MAATTEQDFIIGFPPLISRNQEIIIAALNFNMISMDLRVAALLANSFSSAAFPS